MAVPKKKISKRNKKISYKKNNYINYNSNFSLKSIEFLISSNKKKNYLDYIVKI
jgi:hypothetical protein